MKININPQKSVRVISDIGKKAVENVKNGAKALSDRTKSDSYLRRLKKYNPLFPEIYNSETFSLPNMIMIVDDAERRGIDVCEGAIGWLSNETGMEVLYLYDEAVEMSGIQFMPTVTCDAVYYVDSFDRNRFIRTDCIFSKAHEERLAELKHIAYSLGAKSCSIEISESSTEISMDKKKSEIKAGAVMKFGKVSASQNYELSSTLKDKKQRSGSVTVQFEGNNVPRKPELKWFANDENIKKLIEMRCEGNNLIKSEILELSGASSATMSQKTALAIDIAVGKMPGGKGGSAMESQATKELSSKFIFSIEF